MKRLTILTNCGIVIGVNMSEFDYDTHSGGVEMFGNLVNPFNIINREIYGIINKTKIPKHGSPQDRGSADRYYGRMYNPHFWPEGTNKGFIVTKDSMTKLEIAAYKYGWDNEEDKKDWG